MVSPSQANNGDLRAFKTELKDKAVQCLVTRKTMEGAMRKTKARSAALKAQGKGKRKGTEAFGNKTEARSSPSCPSGRATARPPQHREQLHYDHYYLYCY